ncbi:uncharacterized protein PV07_06327 [Cladophialophora immunda]|uniref:non-specific serine/threonine protein kinase n=1 Tax=Cladophialophora immunda TaxID=569365 RepID=A0A0D2CHK8_9EURO|nr:uncharacterized protein PV07_06327 [Cladophialophora immunda]KIW30593.1 hypothetical protein PV07_06327 [Cladophialophora immunda]OQU99584.1 Protein kinase domain-containing protein [Cladophialophora immunda]
MVDAVDFEKYAGHDGSRWSGKSVMRQFLDDKIFFEWNTGERNMNYDFGNNGRLPMVFLRQLDRVKSQDASIEHWKMADNHGFKHHFAVKRVTARKISSRKKAQAEVENMKTFRHPHIVVLLGTYRYQGLLNIMIFPVACCDLGDYMKSISKNYTTHQRQVKTSSAPEPLGQCGRIYTDSLDVNSLDSTGSPGDSEEPETMQLQHQYSWPLKQHFAAQLKQLAKYFVCLCQTLSYVQAADVRHKDIKPANILVDLSGNVVLTDFGISRHFDKGVAHATEDKPIGTARYSCPELGLKKERDDYSDVFSLGCVFIEMASLILGRSLREFKAYRRRTVNEKSNYDYPLTLEKVHRWIDMLSNTTVSSPEVCKALPPSLIIEVVGALPKIKEMLDFSPHKRPSSHGLWTAFDFPSLDLCEDCNPRHPGAWPLSADQKLAEEKTKKTRAVQPRIQANRTSSVQSIPEDRVPEVVSNSQEAGNTLSRTRSPDQMRTIESVQFPLPAHRLPMQQPSSLKNVTAMTPPTNETSADNGLSINEVEPDLRSSGATKNVAFAEADHDPAELANKSRDKTNPNAANLPAPNGAPVWTGRRRRPSKPSVVASENDATRQNHSASRSSEELEQNLPRRATDKSETSWASDSSGRRRQRYRRRQRNTSSATNIIAEVPVKPDGSAKQPPLPSAGNSNHAMPSSTGLGGKTGARSTPNPLPECDHEEDIILFDVSIPKVSITKFKVLRDHVEKRHRDWRRYNLPSGALFFDANENDKSLIEARAPLGTLGWWVNNVRRRFFPGQLSYIYLINFTSA